MNWKKVEEDVESGPFRLFKWIVIVIIVLSLIGWFLYIQGQVKKPIDTAIDRMVMKNSHQYKEGMEQRAAILEANILEIDILLQGNPDSRSDLVNQKRVLNAQLKAIKINN